MVNQNKFNWTNWHKIWCFQSRERNNQTDQKIKIRRWW